MKVLIVGSGGREHALAWAIARSPRAPVLYAAPGNAGISAIASPVPIPVTEIDALADFAEREKCDLTVVGPETPLVMGIADRFRERGLAIFGPRKAAAMLEGSKAFAKELMRRHSIPTAPFSVHSSLRSAEAALAAGRFPAVIKADGLAAGKGVVIARSLGQGLETLRTMLVEKRFGGAGEQVVIEEFLEGEEVSVFLLCRGGEYQILPTAQDHKRLGDGDQGPNTGGMGAYSPYPRWDSDLQAKVRTTIIEPTVRGLVAEGRSYQGLLYIGLIVRDGEPYVLEYNCRFGDPETQAVLPLVEGELLSALEAVAADDGRPIPSLGQRAGASAVVVLASRGYPDRVEKGFPIRGLDAAAGLPETVVFHAGTRAKGAETVTDGGRVLGITGFGDTLIAALERAYRGVAAVDFEGMAYRKDIGGRGLQ